jgi:hypothetical protein
LCNVNTVGIDARVSSMSRRFVLYCGRDVWESPKQRTARLESERRNVIYDFQDAWQPFQLHPVCHLLILSSLSIVFLLSHTLTHFELTLFLPRLSSRQVPLTLGASQLAIYEAIRQHTHVATVCLNIVSEYMW